MLLLDNNLRNMNIERFVIEASEQGGSRKLGARKHILSGYLVNSDPKKLRPILSGQWLCHADEA